MSDTPVDVAAKLEALVARTVPWSHANACLAMTQAASMLRECAEREKALREALEPFAEWWRLALERSASKNQPITSVEMTCGLRDDCGNYPDEWPEAFRRAAKALEAK